MSEPVQRAPFVPIEYSAEEINAIREVKAELLKRGVDESRIGLCSLTVCTINSKCRVGESADKYVKWLDAVASVGLMSLADDNVWDPTVEHMFPKAYAPAG